MDQKILTTTEAARLLGVSVRTAQLLIEGGTIRSWKTPGGHRRVYHRDVMALIGRSQQAPVLLSVSIIALTGPSREGVFRAALAAVRGVRVRSYIDAHSALLAIGMQLPAVAVIDLDEGPEAMAAVLDSLLTNPALGQVQLVTVGGTAEDSGRRHGARLHKVADLGGLPRAVEVALKRGAARGTPAELPSGFPVSDHEGQRLVALERSGLVDTPAEDAFDRLTWLAARFLEMPIALMTLLTPTRQWFKSRFGLDTEETPREWSFCNHTILQQDTLVLPDLASDERFAANPAVAGEPRFRFYAGHPILDQDGFALGSLCVIDTRPRSLAREDTRILSSLAAVASDEIQLRATDHRLRWALDALEGHSAGNWNAARPLGNDAAG